MVKSWMEELETLLERFVIREASTTIMLMDFFFNADPNAWTYPYS